MTETEVRGVNSEGIKRMVMRITTDQLRTSMKKVPRVTPDSKIWWSLVDSQDMFAIAHELCEQLGLGPIPDDVVYGWKTPRDIIEFVKEELAKKS